MLQIKNKVRHLNLNLIVLSISDFQIYHLSIFFSRILTGMLTSLANFSMRNILWTISRHCSLRHIQLRILYFSLSESLKQAPFLVFHEWCIWFRCRRTCCTNSHFLCPSFSETEYCTQTRVSTPYTLPHLFVQQNMWNENENPLQWVCNDKQILEHHCFFVNGQDSE